MRRFEGKSAVITGASSDVGRAIALALAREGAQITLVGRDQAKLEMTSKSVPGGGKGTQIMAAEFCNAGSLALLAQTLSRTFDTLDFLVHSAGVFKPAPFASASLDDFDTHYQCNVRAPVCITQALLPGIAARKGTIVFINSTVVENPRPEVSFYAASKHALMAIADCLRQEVNKDGVRVVSLFLGRTATPMQERISQTEQRAYDPSRLVQPEDVATIVLDALAAARTVELTNIHLRPAQPPQ